MSEDIKLFSAELRTMCGKHGREQDPLQCANVLFRLGREYKILAEKCDCKHEQKICLIRSAVLLNAAIVRDPASEEVYEQCLADLCGLTLKLTNAKIHQHNLIEKSQHFVQTIDQMRKNTSSRLKELDISGGNAVISRAESLEKLQLLITYEYKSLMSDIMDYSISVIGPCPCEYALIGMGSLALSEITPYSDFEHAYLLQDNVYERDDYEEILEYFRWVSVIFHLIVINFGETIIPSASLPYLNDQECEENNWFYDENTPRGVSFDGMMPHASKFPLGRMETENKHWRTELIKTVSRMLKYLDNDEALKNGYRLAEVLESTCFVSGSQAVYELYRDGLKSKALIGDLDRIAASLDADFNNFSPLTTLPSFHQKEFFDVKRLVYRSTSLFVASLGRIHRLAAQSSFDIARKLFENNVINQSLMEDILFALSLACELRLRVYTKRKGQYDIVSDSLVEMLGQDNLVRYFETALTLQSLVKRSCDNTAVEGGSELGRLSKLAILYWLKCYDKAIAEGRALLKGKRRYNDDDDELFCLHTLFFCFANLEKYCEACEVYEKIRKRPNCCIGLKVAHAVFRKASKTSHPEHRHYRAIEIEIIEEILQRTTSLETESQLKFQLAKRLSQNGRYKQALNHFKQFESGIRLGTVQFNAINLANCDIAKAKCFQELCRNEQAISRFASALARLQVLKKNRCSTNETYMKDIASCHFGLGYSYYKNHQHDLSCESFVTAADIWIEASTSRYDELIAKLTTIVNELIESKILDSAQKFLEILVKSVERKTPEGFSNKHKTDCYFALGFCHYKLNRLYSALHFLKHALSQYTYFDRNNSQNDIGQCNLWLASTCLELGYFAEALHYSLNSLDVLCVTDLVYRSESYCTIGRCLLLLGRRPEALTKLELAYDLYKRRQVSDYKMRRCKELIDKCT